MTVLAIQHICSMRGFSLGQLMLGDDGDLYVVKFQGCPPHPFVLVNEFLATGLAQAAGLTVARCEIVEVVDFMLSSPGLSAQPGERALHYKAGRHFGSRYVGGVGPSCVMDILSKRRLGQVINRHERPGILAFDLWVNNRGSRQAVYSKQRWEEHYTATFIDHGDCFDPGGRGCEGGASRGVGGLTPTYREATCLEEFRPWIDRIASVASEAIWAIADAIPPEWYGNDRAEIDRIVGPLLERRGQVASLVDAFLASNREPYPNLRKQALAAAPSSYSM